MTDNRNSKRTLIGIGVFILAVVSGVLIYSRGQRPTIPDASVPTPTASGTDSPADGSETQLEKYGISISLSEGQDQPQTVDSMPATNGEPLSPDEVSLLLARLPALPLDPSQQTSFNLPPESPPPPRPGNVIEAVFPPFETEPVIGADEAGPLKVLRFSPEGEIPIAPFISVTFNQPMVPLGTLGDLAEADVPLKIEPSMPGTWRWLGTKTLTFEYDSALIDRLPKATEFTLTVPAGTKSINGGVLAEAVTWTLKTPPPTIVASYPINSSAPLDPIFFIAFDQRIDPAEVLKTIKVQAGYQNVDVVLASQAEIEKDEYVNGLAVSTLEGRWLAFRATEPFDPETTITVTVGPQTPSAEGPLTTTAEQTFSFSTYAPLKVVEHRCSWYEDQCPPLSPFYITFNNPLDVEAFKEDFVRVDPEIPGMIINAYGGTIEISGETSGQTTYTVTLSEKIQDMFGQQLGDDVTLKFKVDKAEPLLVNTNQHFITLDPNALKPTFSVYAINYKKLNLKVYSVTHTDWPQFGQFIREWRQTDQPPAMPGKLISDGEIALDIPDDTLSQVDIDLSKYMKGESGHFIVVVEPPAGLFESDEAKWRRESQTIISWVQVTQIGLDAFNDHSEVVAWTTDLKDGKPLAGVRIQPDTGGEAVVSGKDGTVRFDIPDGASYLVATKGKDSAILPHSNYYYYWSNDTWYSAPPSDSLVWYVFDDRQMYRPGEEVHIKGWIRRIGNGQGGDVALMGADLSSVSYQITEPQGNTLTEGQVNVNALGGFDFVFTVPNETNLGHAVINFTANGNLGELGNGQSFYHNFQIQEFRRPEFEVTARNETSGPYFAG